MAPEDLEECLKEAWEKWRDHSQRRSATPQRGAMNARNRVSVVIPTFGNAELVAECLDSVSRQTVSACDVVVVNDGSPSDDISYRCSQLPHVRCIDTSEHLGFAAAANRGIEECLGDYILLLNDDAVIEEGCLEALQAALDSDPTVGFVTPRVARHSDQRIVDSAGHGMTRSGYSFNFGAGMPAGQALAGSQYVMGAPGAVVMYRRSMLTEVGFFDEDFVWYLEDLDLSFRAQLWGYRCLYVATAVARHRGQASSGALYTREKVFRTARNTVATLLKNMPKRLLCKNSLRIARFLVLQQLYHLSRTRQGAAYFRGLCSGIRTAKQWMKKRKRVLGGRRINDGAVENLLRESEEFLSLSHTRWR